MTIASAASLAANGNGRLAWATDLDASDAVAQEILGSARWDVHPIWGLRGFEYVRFHDAAVKGSWNTQIANIAVANATGTSTTTVVLAGTFTADILKDCLVRCKDDTGAAGAAPEGETARIISNTTGVLYLNPDDAWSVAPSSGDDFEVILPHRVSAAGAGDESLLCRGVAMATQTIYYYGWVQFYGWNPFANFVAAGTVVTGPKGIITGSGGLATVSSTSSRSILVGSLPCTSITTDQVGRTNLCHIQTGVAGSPMISA